MARRKIYTLEAANALIINSEGRNSPKSNQPGHSKLEHIGGTEAQAGGRLKQSLNSSSTTPIIINPATNAMADKADIMQRWISAGLQPNNKTAKQAYQNALPPPKKTAGAFLDETQASQILTYALNTAAGQQALGKLDAGSSRELFEVQVVAVSSIPALKMYTASIGTGGADMSDVSHIGNFSKVMVILDNPGANDVHLQTIYPIA